MVEEPSIENFVLKGDLFKIRADLKDIIIEFMKKNNINQSVITEAFGLLPIGTEILFAKEWNLETALAIATAVGYKMDLQLRPELVSPIDSDRYSQEVVYLSRKSEYRSTVNMVA